VKAWSSILHLRRLSVLASVAALALGLSACGHKKNFPTIADSDALYVTAGHIAYQVQISRELNPYDVEDKEYLAGQSSPSPKPDEDWFAVLLRAENLTHSPLTTTDSFDIVDTQGKKYYPIPLNSQVNPLAWTAQTLKPQDTEPAPGSLASFGPTQGGALLFKINSSAYSNRPLTLRIHAPGQASPSTVSLDL
jgi:hypothetical protein